METLLDSLVKAGKVRALDASAMYGYQIMNMQIAAEKNGWTKFVSMQDHYILLYREDERKMIPICRQFGVSLTPYSPLAAGRLSRSILTILQTLSIAFTGHYKKSGDNAENTP